MRQGFFKLCTCLLLLGLFWSVAYSREPEVPLTIETLFTYTETQGATIELVGLADGDQKLFSLVWAKDSSWFAQWWLRVEGDADFLPEGTGKHLVSLSPRTGHQYRTVLSYCSKEHLIDLSVYDLTAGEHIYRGRIGVAPYGATLNPSLEDSHVAVTVHESIYLPVGVAWRLSQMASGGRSIRISKNAPLRVSLDPVPIDATGEFVLVTADGVLLDRFASSPTGLETSIDPAPLSVGEGVVRLEYRVDGGTWDLGHIPVEVVEGIVDIVFSNPTYTLHEWISDVEILADGPVSLEPFKVSADIEVFRGGKWQLMVKDMLLWKEGIQVTGEPTGLKLGLGNLPLDQHIARITFSVELPATVAHQVSGASQSVIPVELLLGTDPAALYSEGILEVHPVAIPVGDNLFGSNWHFGWPVATMVDDTIVLVYQRTPAHWGNLPADQYTSRAVVIRSRDGGKTWSKPVDIRQFIKAPVDQGKAGFGNAIGTMGDGSILLITPYGVFRSKDAGVTWEHLPEAFSGAQLQGPRTNMGPRIVEHPEYGAMAFGHYEIDSLGTMADETWIRYSKDLGETWYETKQDLPSFAKPVEPAALVFADRLVLLARSHGSYDASDETWRYVQLVSSEEESLSLEPYSTNIKASDVRALSGNGGFGPWSQDTVDISYNPVTQRIEAVVTNRSGGGEGQTKDHSHMTLNLWSIDPADLLTGSSNWRYEATLLAKRGVTPIPLENGLHPDGMHPGGAVIDLERGVQHIYVYLGFTEGPAGIFQITRTLDTPALRSWLERQLHREE